MSRLTPERWSTRGQAGSVLPTDLCQPILCRAPLTDEGWLFELKHDGYRAFARTGARADLMSRWGRSMALAFPEVTGALRTLRLDAVLDAELVVSDAGRRSDWNELPRLSIMKLPDVIEEAAAKRPAALIVFDVLQATGVDRRPLPLRERKAWIREHVTPCTGVQAIEQDFEGIVAKRLDARHVAGRHELWLKIKNRQYSRREALVGHGSAQTGDNR